MLHIILGILKIIGILLGILLLLLLAIMLAVLFAPVQYRVQAEKQGERLQAGIKVSWLLHIVSASLSVDMQEGQNIVIRLFGIPLPLFGKKLPDKGGGGRRKKKCRGHRKKGGSEREDEPKFGGAEDVGEVISSPAADFDENEDFETDEWEDYFSEEEDSIDTPGVGTEQPFAGPDAPTCEPEPSSAESEPSASESEPPVTEPEPPAVKSGPPGAEESTGPEDAGDGAPRAKFQFSFRTIYGRIKEIYKKVCALLRKLIEWLRGLGRIPQRIRETMKKAQRTAERLRKAAARAGELLAKPGELLELAETLEVREVFGNAAGYVTYLLHHYGPRRISGFLRFGTGNPATTAQLTGLIYLILPARAEDFTVTPEFEEIVFETKVSLAGRIRACHLLRVGWQAFRDKKLRRMIKYFRSR